MKTPRGPEPTGRSMYRPGFSAAAPFEHRSHHDQPGAHYHGHHVAAQKADKTHCRKHFSP